MAITRVDHAGAALVKVVPLAAFEAAVAVGVGFSPGVGCVPCRWRHLCRRQQQQLQRAGVELRAGFELEWLVASPGAGDPGGPYSADRLVRARLLIHRVTRRFGWRCSFSPKPSLERVGNGGHLHLSLRRDGVPLLEGGDGEAGLRAAGAGVLAALLAELPALMALACPQAVSYQRMGPSSWSAPFQVWGVENREAALRLIPAAADGAPAHLELKVADLAANPYLLLGAVQALVAPRLPASLTEASAAFAASGLLRQALGEALHGSLLDSQAAEERRAEGCSEA